MIRVFREEVRDLLMLRDRGRALKFLYPASGCAGLRYQRLALVMSDEARPCRGFFFIGRGYCSSTQARKRPHRP